MCSTIRLKFRSAVSYKIDGKETQQIPAQISGFEKIEPVYKKLPGWQTSTYGIDKYDQLPEKAKQYLEFIEKESGAKIAIISTGPDREQTMFMPEFVSMLDDGHADASGEIDRGPIRMTVLAVTWIANPGHEDEVAGDLHQAAERARARSRAA